MENCSSLSSLPVNRSRQNEKSCYSQCSQAVGSTDSLSRILWQGDWRRVQVQRMARLLILRVCEFCAYRVKTRTRLALPQDECSLETNECPWFLLQHKLHCHLQDGDIWWGQEEVPGDGGVHGRNKWGKISCSWGKIYTRKNKSYV